MWFFFFVGIGIVRDGTYSPNLHVLDFLEMVIVWSFKIIKSIKNYAIAASFCFFYPV